TLLAAYVWTGAGADINWSTPKNWSIGGLAAITYPGQNPNVADTVTFDGQAKAGSKIAFLDKSGITIDGLSIQSTYTGTLVLSVGSLEVDKQFSLTGVADPTQARLAISGDSDLILGKPNAATGAFGSIQGSVKLSSANKNKPAKLIVNSNSIL